MSQDRETGDKVELERPPSPFPFTPPPTAEVISVTHLLELRRDLGLPEMSQLIIKPTPDPLGQWSPEAKAAILGSSSLGSENVLFATGGAELLERPGFGPELLLNFARVYSWERPGWSAAAAAFFDEVEPFAPPPILDQVRYLRESEMPHGMFDWITVVSGTTFVPAARWPAADVDQAATLGEQLDVVLRGLSDFLIALCLARHDFAIGPIARGDLPSASPVIVEALEAPPATGPRVGFFTFLGIHSSPDFPRREARDFEQIDDEELLAAQIARAHFFGEEPFFLFFELMQDAIRQFNNARFSASAIWVGSSVEVMLATAIREAGAARSIPPSEVDRLLDLPFRNLVEHHLSKFVLCDVDLGDQTDPFGRWWQGGYQIRSRVVHEGHRATRQEADQVLEDANALVVAVQQALSADPVTEGVGAALHWGARKTTDNEQ